MIGASKRKRDIGNDGAASPSGRQARAFKWARTHGPSDQWRQRLLRNCLQRMKESRSADLAERRKERMRIVEEETKRWHPTANSTLVSIQNGRDNNRCTGNGHASMEGDQEELVAILEDLDHALQTERMEQQRESDDAVREVLECVIREIDDDVAQLVDMHEGLSLTPVQRDDFVLCPVCNRSGLMLQSGTLYCACGLRVDCGTEGNLTLAVVRNRLSETLTKHQLCCSGRLGFGVRQTFGSFLWASCATCRFESVVL